MLNRLLPDMYIFTDHYTGSESGKSPGYGISLVAETTTGCILSSECAATHSGASKLQLPEDLGTQAAMSLLQEIKLGGVVNSTHQVFICEAGKERRRSHKLSCLPYRGCCSRPSKNSWEYSLVSSLTQISYMELFLEAIGLFQQQCVHSP
ncbi:RNA 3'-terminal phosphate cyclase-like protein [Selaginella moellendorffii]|uniref:RNA 3'-terminal phosphate cyclase-like protein n=1 Tax=Selaginella moellendorffii TaxID=88036 RepID=UPI000D1CE752|nr:RNA 3'-terminal phosphate cyclase-like protein [Selaginella moellendorffii]|eukprot:XP_002985738.2 RNA 3'-terminal phosphate cyclase-like protein [Selaginella moellendorffii]